MQRWGWNGLSRARDFSAIYKRRRGGAHDSRKLRGLVSQSGGASPNLVRCWTLRCGSGGGGGGGVRVSPCTFKIVLLRPTAAVSSSRTVKIISNLSLSLHSPPSGARPASHSFFCLPFAVIFCRCPLGGDLQMIHSYNSGHVALDRRTNGQSWKPTAAIT